MSWIEKLSSKCTSFTIPFLYRLTGTKSSADNFYSDTADFYSSLYSSNKNDDIPMYASIAARIGSPLLDVACGDGRLAVQLARQGHTVFSFDKSQTLLEHFKQRIVKLLPEDRARIHIVRSEMQNIPFKNHFKLAIIPYNSFNHLMKKEEQQFCLRGIFNALVADGLLVMEVLPYHETYNAGLRFRKTGVLSDGVTNIAAYSKVDHDIAQDTHTVNWYLKIKKSGKRTRRIVSTFVRKDIPLTVMKTMIIETGFKLEEIRYAYSMNEKTGSKRILIARKPK